MITFERARESALTKIATFSYSPAPQADIVIVRDLYGRLRICIDASAPDKKDKAQDKLLSNFEQEWITALERFAPEKGSTFLFKSDFFDPASVWDSPDRHRVVEGGTQRSIWFIDRAVGGQDWLRKALPRGKVVRFAMHGIKGGVGRSTAAAVLAHALATQGKRVLIADLDLESPGISSTLLSSERIPEYGIVDYFVETAVGIDDPERFMQSMLAQSQVADGLPGSIQMLCAYGQERADYVGKLSRTYVPMNRADQMRTFADRLSEMLLYAEKIANADVVLLDSRSGVDDIAAATLARLNAEVLFFGTASKQTWLGYELLLNHMSRRDDVKEFRKRVSVIAALVPETEVEQYMRAVREQAYGVFSDLMYDPGGDDPAAFSFDVNDVAAPHFPIPVGYFRGLVNFDPLDRPEQLSDERIKANFSGLIELVDTLSISAR